MFPVEKHGLRIVSAVWYILLDKITAYDQMQEPQRIPARRGKCNVSNLIDLVVISDLAKLNTKRGDFPRLQ